MGGWGMQGSTRIGAGLSPYQTQDPSSPWGDQSVGGYQLDGGGMDVMGTLASMGNMQSAFRPMGGGIGGSLVGRRMV